MPHSRQVDLQSLLEHFLQWEPTTVEGEIFPLVANMDFKKNPSQTEPSPSHPEKKSCYP